MLPNMGQVAALGQCVGLGFLVKHGCLGPPVKTWQEVSQEEGWLLDLAGNLKDVSQNKKKKPTHFLGCYQKMLVIVAFVVCLNQKGLDDRTKGNVTITIRTFHASKSQDAKAAPPPREK